MSIRVLVCDEQVVARAGVRALLQPAEDIHVVGEAENLHQALAAVARFGPDVVLIGTGLPILDGLQTTWRLAGPDAAHPTPVIIVSTPERRGGVLEAVRAGASGFVYKDTPGSELVHAVRVVATGKAWLAPSATRCLIDWVANRTPMPTEDTPAALARLTRRELDVLKLLADGYSVAGIAKALSVSRPTVRSHIHHMVTKLGLDDRVQAVALAYKYRLVTTVDTRLHPLGPTVQS